MKRYSDHNTPLTDEQMNTGQLHAVEQMFHEMRQDIVPPPSLLNSILDSLPVREVTSPIIESMSHQPSVLDKIGDWLLGAGRILLPLGAAVAVVLFVVQMNTNEPMISPGELGKEAVGQTVLNEEVATGELEALSLEHIEAEALAFSSTRVDFSQLIAELDRDMALLSDITVSLEMLYEEDEPVVDLSEQSIRPVVTVEVPVTVDTETAVRPVSSSLPTRPRR